MKRREYQVEAISVNNISVTKVVIDPHYEVDHLDHMNDSLILELIQKLDGRIEVPESIDEDGYSYFATLLMLNKKQYKLVWLLEEGEIYVGVLTAYRDDRSK